MTFHIVESHETRRRIPDVLVTCFCGIQLEAHWNCYSFRTGDPIDHTDGSTEACPECRDAWARRQAEKA